MQINLTFDSVDTGVPAGFQAAMRAAADILGAAIAGNYTINLDIGWGSFNNVIDPTLTGSGGAYAGPSQGQLITVSTLRGWLAARTLTADDSSGLNALAANIANLPANNGVYVSSAQLRALGHYTGSAGA